MFGSKCYPSTKDSILKNSIRYEEIDNGFGIQRENTEC